VLATESYFRFVAQSRPLDESWICCVYADGMVLLNQKRLWVDLGHEDEWNFRILWRRKSLRAGFAERTLAERFHKTLRRMRPCHGSSKLRSRNAQPKPPL
jgi:hypothetical protein